MNGVSKKRYAVAVILSAVFGIFGIHFFYLGRIGYGLLDLGLSLFAIYLFFDGQLIGAVIVAAIDYLHSVVTFRLLTGNEYDGEGKRIPYPG
ncbi:MAG: NINE protein [Candidatus Binatia bacterium]